MNIRSMTKEEKVKRGIKNTVRLIGNFPGLWERTINQTPYGSCQWGNTLFVASGDADMWVVLNSYKIGPNGKLSNNINLPPKERVWGLHMEPSEYVKLFGFDTYEEHKNISRFYTNCDYLVNKNSIYRYSPPYVHFHIGRSFDFLKNTTVPEKKLDLCLIASDLQNISGHSARLDFIDRLNRSNINFSFWGRSKSFKKYERYKGLIDSKWAAHSQCKYSIVIENSISPYYWSEKIADAILGFSLPLYFGCPLIGEYLPHNSFIQIDINDPDCPERIEEIVNSREYEKRFDVLLEARRILLEEQNLYAFLTREINIFSGH